MAERRPLKQCRIQFTISPTHSQLLSQILQILETNQAEFVKAITYYDINRLADKLLGIKLGSPEFDYHRLYGYWLIRRGLKANPYRHKINTSITQTALIKYAEKNIKKAMCNYSRILHNQKKYNWCEVQHFEPRLSNDIKYFLADAKPDCFTRYARPADITDIDIVEKALLIELWK